MAERDSLYRVGGGAVNPVEILTDGQVRQRVLPDTPVVEHQIVTSDPAANTEGLPRTFMRTVAGKQQWCVRFDSGAIQVIATEPD
jgi:hypothetical protein